MADLSALASAFNVAAVAARLSYRVLVEGDRLILCQPLRRRGRREEIAAAKVAEMISCLTA